MAPYFPTGFNLPEPDSIRAVPMTRDENIRSKAVGPQQGSVRGSFTSGQVDLKGNFGCNNGYDQHSAEFNWPVQQVGGFYRQLGLSLSVLPPNYP